MAWPPAVLPADKTDLTPQKTTHPAAHNATNLAINDAVGEIRTLLEQKYIPKYKVTQQAQTIVTTNVYGQAIIFPASGFTGNYPVVIAQDMNGSTNLWHLVGVAPMDTAAGSFSIFARPYSNLGVWAADAVIRIAWMSVSGL